MFKDIRKHIKTMTVGIISCLMTVTLSSTAYASVDALVIKDKTTNTVYEYNYNELTDSLIESMTSDSKGQLYKNFKESQKAGSPINALHDDKNNDYVSYDSVINAAIDALSNGEKFNLDNFVETCNENNKVTFTSIIERKESNGKVIENKKTNNFEVIDIN